MRANTVGLPPCPKGNSMTMRVIVRDGCGKPINIAGNEFAFIANRDLSGKIRPPVFIRWWEETSFAPGFAVYETSFTVPGELTATLEPGGYYFNVVMRVPGYIPTLFPTPQQEEAVCWSRSITTVMAGTWAITAVPGMLFGSGFGTWRPQLMNQFPPRIPRRAYAY
jgi:hypothetical protein